ncbi:MAG TPA: hypothetical protein VLG50_05075 [Candidatus Saccharimonadales bacterium]|nr:hypothetical protein [Candidatus Saccharimonadales bacterium]
MNIETHFDKVCHFHIQCGITIPTTEQRDLFIRDPNLINKAVGFIEEEYKEYLDAIEKDDECEKLDALIDISYFTLRLCALLGSNMDDKKFKHVEWRGIYVDVIGKKCVDVIKDLLDDIVQQVKNENYDALIHALYNMEIIVEKIGIQRLNHQFKKWYEAFDLIHQNNMSKLCQNEAEAIDTVTSYEGHSIYKHVAYRQAPDQQHWVVYDQDTGKILKSNLWKPVDLTLFFK